MSGIGTGYDLSATTYSPEGKIFQLEYANKAVENSGTAIGVKCKDGVVFGVEKLISSTLLEPGSNRRITAFTKHIGGAFSGLLADTRGLVKIARSESERFKSEYHRDIPVKVMASRLAAYVHAYTLYGSVRPFGVATIVGGVDKDGPQLFMIEPSGAYCGYHGVATGKNVQASKTEIEKLDFKNITCREAVIEVAKIIYKVHDEIKDKLFELELGWVCEESGNLFQLVPEDLRQEAIRAAEQAVREAEEVEEEEEEEM